MARDRRTRWRRICLRYSERGLLCADFAIFRVRAAATGRQAAKAAAAAPLCEAEWLVIRKVSERRRQYRYTLVNAPAEAPIERVVEPSARRYFVERTFQDAKSEIGWADFQARKYRAWEHHLALVAAALLFAAQTKLEWELQCRRDTRLALELGVTELPALSTANLRELMRAALPVAQLSPAEAMLSVIDRLVRRARSIGSRLRAKIKSNDSS